MPGRLEGKNAIVTGAAGYVILPGFLALLTMLFTFC